MSIINLRDIIYDLYDNEETFQLSQKVEQNDYALDFTVLCVIESQSTAIFNYKKKDADDLSYFAKKDLTLKSTNHEAIISKSDYFIDGYNIVLKLPILKKITAKDTLASDNNLRQNTRFEIQNSDKAIVRFISTASEKEFSAPCIDLSQSGLALAIHKDDIGFLRTGDNIVIISFADKAFGSLEGNIVYIRKLKENDESTYSVAINFKDKLKMTKVLDIVKQTKD